MDELSARINSGTPVVVAQIVSKLSEIIKTKQTADICDLVEYKFLKENCVCDNNAVNIVAAEAILKVVKNDPSLVKPIITDFIAAITTSKCPPNIAFLINNLLAIDLETQLAETNSYKCWFNLRLPQHPFIVMLNENVNCWSWIFREISHTYLTQNNVSHYDHLYKPVFLYALCNPNGGDLLPFRQKLWDLILGNESRGIIDCLLAWMQVENKEAIQTTSEFLTDLSTLDLYDPNLLFIFQVSALHQLILSNNDPREFILMILESQVADVKILNPVLLILSKTIMICAAVFLLPVLKLCKTFVCQSKCDTITANILKGALLQWMASPCALTLEASNCAAEIFSLLETNCKNNPRLKSFTKFYNTYQNLIITNADVYTSLQIYIVLGKCKNENSLITWLERLSKAPTFFLVEIFNFLIGLFLTEFEEKSINNSTFELIKKCIDFDKNLASNVLTVILYKLTKTTDSLLHYRLLKSLPKLAVVKDNLQKIISTIQALSNGGNTLSSFSAILMLDLWKWDNKYYPYLEKVLISSLSPKGNKWEFYVTRAFILKELCTLKPELYGKEIVAHLSKILNECNTPEGALASALAIDGITQLCKSEIIDAVTTWATLAPVFQTEARIPVIRSICALISEIPTLSYTEAYPKLTEDVVKKLWDYILLNPDDEVWKAALASLTHFPLEQIVAQAPDDFFDEEIVNIRKSGNVVPGTCWIHFLKNCNSKKLRIAGDFLIKMVSLEVSTYLKFIYQVKGTREPVDYSYLPLNSIVRGISTYIKSKVLKWKSSVYKEVYLECLRIFSQEYSKPLPPLDWCFLQELFHETEAKDFCISIASRQVVLSGTARRFIVNYIEAVDCTNVKDVLHVYSNLKYLANSVQPFTLKPFLEKTILTAVGLFTEDEKQLTQILDHLRETLRDKDIQEANKILIAQIISDVFNDLDITSQLFEILLECVILFPFKFINDMTSPKSLKEVPAQWFKKAIKVRCYWALNTAETPLNLLNDLIEYGANFPNLSSFIFENFAHVFQKHKDNTECVLWVLELIGQIQAVTAEKSDEKEVFFLCNVFILATVVFSGHFTLMEDFSNVKNMYRLFPRAVSTLLDVNHWSICTTQALEWFHHMYTQKILLSEYDQMFLQCLQCLRHLSEFSKNMKWTKYLNVEF